MTELGIGESDCDLVFFFFLVNRGTDWKENFNAFAEHSKKLYHAWGVTLLSINKFQIIVKNKGDFNETKEDKFNDRVKLGMKKSSVKLCTKVK